MASFMSATDNDDPDKREGPRAEIAQLRDEMEWIKGAGERQNQMLRANGFKFETRLDKPDAERTSAEMWEKLAFSMHIDIWEIAQRAEAALKAAGFIAGQETNKDSSR